MCQRITCKDCGRPSFRGCGRHVESVLGDVPPTDRCQCGATVAKAHAGDTAASGIVEWISGIFKSGDRRNDP